MLGGSVTLQLPRETVRSTSSPQAGTCSGDAVMYSGVSTHASGCSRQRSGYGSQCCAVQWYYDEIAGCTRPKTRLERKRPRGLVVGLPFVQMLHARTSATSRNHQHSSYPRATNATCVTFAIPASCSPTALANCSNSNEQDAG
jgi:hypothetical protein